MLVLICNKCENCNVDTFLSYPFLCACYSSLTGWHFGRIHYFLVLSTIGIRETDIKWRGRGDIGVRCLSEWIWPTFGNSGCVELWQVLSSTWRTSGRSNEEIWMACDLKGEKHPKHSFTYLFIYIIRGPNINSKIKQDDQTLISCKTRMMISVLCWQNLEITEVKPIKVALVCALSPISIKRFKFPPPCLAAKLWGWTFLPSTTHWLDSCEQATYEFDMHY